MLISQKCPSNNARNITLKNAFSLEQCREAEGAARILESWKSIEEAAALQPAYFYVYDLTAASQFRNCSIRSNLRHFSTLLINSYRSGVVLCQRGEKSSNQFYIHLGLRRETRALECSTRFLSKCNAFFNLSKWKWLFTQTIFRKLIFTQKVTCFG